MDCNKDEAVRAKQIAESRMQRGDFVEALKFAMKAKKLYPDIDNIAQILTVCEVHIAARNKLCGSDMDWYGILQTQQFADEATIKKQYRKLALLLHPDKNKCAGAEAAFKLIGEANMVLNDQAKRSLYDRDCRVSVRTAAPKPSSHHSSGNAHAAKHYGNATNYQRNFYSHATSRNTHQHDEQQTFWTSCQHCNAKHKCFKNVVSTTLCCQKCLKSFTAYDLGYEGVPSQRYSYPVSMKKCATGAGGYCKGGRSKNGNVAAGVAKVNIETSKPAESKAKESQTSTNVGSKRVRQSAPDSRESCKNENGNYMKGANVQENTIDPSGHNARRSSGQKQHVSFMESPQDDDFESPFKQPRQNELFNTTEVEKLRVPASGGLSNNNIPASSAAGVHDSKADHSSPLKSNVPSCPVMIACPDAEFSDFEKDKAEDCFAVNQLWAIYDPTDAVPRYYAFLAKKMVSPFKLRIIWLEPNPDDQGEIDWHKADLPIACGRFKLGFSEKTADRAMFSHQMHCIKGSVKGSYLVYPMKGETWAIFKDWDIKWSSNPKIYSKYEFEYVEILSDFAENVGIEVAYLGKVKGFGSLFQKTEKNGISLFCVPPHELYRFSHRIPSYRMTGNEGEGVPRGSFELDPAGLPIHLL